MTTPASEPPLVVPRQQRERQASLRYGVRTSALALAVTTTGRLCFPPLQVAGLPLLVYMGIPAAQQAYDELTEQGKPGPALAETVVLVVCLAGGYYWVGALGFWLYYGSRALLAEKPQRADIPQPGEMVPATTHLWKEGTSSVVATAALQPGDQVLLQSGEVVPMDGLITEGVAWVQPQARAATICGLRKAVGDRVVATDLVLVGRICVRATPAD